MLQIKKGIDKNVIKQASRANRSRLERRRFLARLVFSKLGLLVKCYGQENP